MLTDRLLKFRAAMQSSAVLGIPILKTKNAKSMDDVLDEHIATVTKALEKVKAGEKSTDDRLTDLRSEITELSQKMAQGRRSGDGEPRLKSWGEQFTDSDRYRDYVEKSQDERPRELRVTVKGITSAANSGGALGTPTRDDVQTMPRRRTIIRDLLTVAPVETNLVQFPSQTTRTNNAAPAAEGTLKPQSDYAWELKDVPIRTIAHWTEANRQIMDDAPQLEGLINEELIYGLDLVEDAELLYGDGSGEHLSGLVVGATPYAAPFTIAGATMIDQVGLALLQSALTDEDPDGVVMHPSDWLRIRLAKNADGDYIYGPPGVAVVPVIFGKPVIPTKGILIDKFLVGPFKRGARLYDRMATEVRISDQDRDNFVRNRLTIRAEKRLGLGKRLQPSFVYGDFGNVA